tara:strand:- start:2836 stop:3255 length:420 start_codon:yes stop_codon:yes gene_type:complete
MATATKQTKSNAIKEFIRERGEVSRKEIIRFLMVDIRGVDGDYFDNNYSEFSGQSATNFTQWRYNGHVQSNKGKYSLTPEGAISKLGMYQTLPSVELVRVKNRLANQKGRIDNVNQWENRALRAEAELATLRRKLIELI